MNTLEDQPVCHIYQWVAHPTYGAVCNHCARMMDGFTMDDLIAGSGTGSLTEEDVVAYVRGGDPTEQELIGSVPLSGPILTFLSLI